MVLGRPLVFSAGIHVFVLGVLLFAGYARRGDEAIVQTVRLRFSGTDFRGTVSGSAGASRPEDVPRESRAVRKLPAAATRFPTDAADRGVGRAESPAVAAVRDAVSQPVHMEPDRIAADDLLDPLAGMEDYLPGDDAAATDGFFGNWSFSWEDGRRRAILSSLEMDIDSFPETPERLMNAAVAITVSPGGEVLSAEIAEPGSGDVRIDRYLVSWALALVFEPIPEDHPIQRGVFRLVFEGSSQ